MTSPPDNTGRSGDKMCLSPTLKTYCTVEFADGDTN